MSQSNTLDIVTLEAKLADLEAQPESDLHERLLLRIELTVLYQTQSDSRALTFAKESYALIQAADREVSSEIILPCLAQLAGLSEATGNPDQGLQYGLNALRYINMDAPTTYTIQLFRALGVIYTSLGNFEIALQYHQQALDWAKKLHLLAWEGAIYTSLGYLYETWGKHNLSLEILLRALQPEIYETLRTYIKAVLHNNIAANYLLLGDTDTALIYIEKALQIRELAVVICTYGEILTERQEYDLAQQAFDRAITLATQNEDRFAACMALRSQGELYHRQGKIAMAIQALEQALEMADSHKGRQAQCLHMLAELYGEQSQYQLAFIYQQRYVKTKAEFAQERVELQTRAMEMMRRIELTKQETELAQNEQEMLRNRNELLQQLVSERDHAINTQSQLFKAQTILVNTIAELSTPILPLLPGILISALIGAMDSKRIIRMTETLLESISIEGAQVTIIDITGVPIVDTHVAAAMMSLARAVKLLGCQIIIVGIRPEIAQTLVGLGVDLGEINTYATLANGLHAALAITGFTIAKKRMLSGKYLSRYISR